MNETRTGTAETGSELCRPILVSLPEPIRSSSENDPRGSGPSRSENLGCRYLLVFMPADPSARPFLSVSVQRMERELCITDLS